VSVAACRAPRRPCHRRLYPAGHDVGEGSGAEALPFVDFLRRVAGTGRGVKVDIKEWGAVDGVLAALQELQESWPGEVRDHVHLRQHIAHLRADCTPRAGPCRRQCDAVAVPALAAWAICLL